MCVSVRRVVGRDVLVVRSHPIGRSLTGANQPDRRQDGIGLDDGDEPRHDFVRGWWLLSEVQEEADGLWVCCAV